LGLFVVRWGDKIGTRGSDVISVHPTTGAVTLWDTKFRSADVSLKLSPTFDSTSPDWQSSKLPVLQEQAVQAIRSSSLSQALQDKAVSSVLAGDFSANTVGAGNARNSVPLRFCRGKPC
jgi:filamentous hemagglutinin